jgi:hypothetical protein
MCRGAVAVLLDAEMSSVGDIVVGDGHGQAAMAGGS